MSSVNKVILVGHLGKAPELRHTTSGTPVCNLALATDRVFTDKEGNKKEETDWHRVVAWGKQGETCSTYLTKGRLVYVEGRIQTRAWDDKEGNKRYTTEVVSRRVVFLGGRAGEGGPVEAAPPPMEATPPPQQQEDDIPF